MEAPRVNATRSNRHPYASLSRAAGALSTRFKARTEKAVVFTRRHRKKFRTLILLIALVLFCGGVVLSLRAEPDLLEKIEIAPLAVIFFALLPIVMAISTLDFQVLARLSGVQIGYWRAFKITIYTRAANMLPIPGSMAVRAAALKANGATFKRSGGMMFLLTVIWGGMGFCFSAAWLLGYGSYLLAALLGGAGVAILTSCIIASLKARLDLKKVGASAILRFLLIAIEALMLMLALRALGLEVNYSQTAIMVIASFIASIAPAGIGVRETMIAVLAPLAGVDPALGFLAGVVMRVTGMTFLAVCCAVALLTNLVRRARSEIDLADPSSGGPHS